jgi:hypothetical protein
MPGRAERQVSMITLMAIIMFVLFLKIVELIFGAGLRLLGWLFSGLGFIISILLAVSVIGFVFDIMPVLLLVFILMIARRPV